MDRSQEEFTPDIDKPSLSNEELNFFHKILHFYFKQNQLDSRKPYGWSQDDILLCHSMVAEEYYKRHLEHDKKELIDDITCIYNNKTFDNEKSPVYYSEEELANEIFGKE